MSKFFDAGFAWKRMLQNAAGVVTNPLPQAVINEQLDKVAQVTPFV